MKQTEKYDFLIKSLSWQLKKSHKGLRCPHPDPHIFPHFENVTEYKCFEPDCHPCIN